MPRHLLEITALTRADVDELLIMADEGPQPHSLSGTTFLSAFFQESTRTRLGFMSAAARQGAAVLDIGAADRLRTEPATDQQMVLAEAADVLVLRHWDAAFQCELARRGRCAVVNAGAGGRSHPTQALIDLYTLARALERDLSGLRVQFLGDALLRSAVSFRELAGLFGIVVSQARMTSRAAARADADVVYIQSQSNTDYQGARLNVSDLGPALPRPVADGLARSSALIMHALPRGPELPDELMGDPRCLVAKQIENGLPMRSAVLRWVMLTG